MEYLSKTTEILLMAVFNLMAIFFVMTVVLRIIKKFLNKATGKKNEKFD